MTSPPPLLATIWRGSLAEAALRGHAVVADSAGSVLSAVGDPQVVVPMRSCVKPIQAFPFVELAADRLGVTSEEVAIACGSHYGEDVHVATVRRMLARVQLDETSLACGPQLPVDPASARRLLAAGQGPQRIYNNCSGKHAGMLAACVVAGWPVQGYADPEHPCQLAVRAALSRVLGVSLDGAGWGIDGCGLPTYGVPLVALARAFAAGQREAAFRRCQDAMAEHPRLVAGTGAFDTALLEHAGDTITAKIGGAALWAGVLRAPGVGVALKLEAGNIEAIPPVALAILQRLGAVPQPPPGALEPFGRPSLRNWEGAVVGETRVEAAALEALTPVVRPPIVPREEC
ncbi:MAG TPA: asparaginase [Candidatus Acidoferrales bacterium]|nr:asparaginase [Candidatus Acidoferrales bacterium]